MTQSYDHFSSLSMGFLRSGTRIRENPIGKFQIGKSKIQTDFVNSEIVKRGR